MADFQRLLLDYYSDGLSVHDKRKLRARQREKAMEYFNKKETNAAIYDRAMTEAIKGDSDNEQQG